MAVRQQQQRFGVDVVGRDPVARRQRMIGRGDEQERLVVQRQRLQLTIAGSVAITAASILRSSTSDNSRAVMSSTIAIGACGRSRINAGSA